MNVYAHCSGEGSEIVQKEGLTGNINRSLRGARYFKQFAHLRDRPVLSLKPLSGTSEQS
jgi:hypothetical protein